ncbi:carboxylesterase/lipase family protein [Streptomyces sp. NBC_00083]|uniref:carboxylesterase/lipase family protein n=1 Tax=Streptomyces sp. NBC_00083 TaxID=2975647 RepID=UPI0022582938|nr:carboxylesterase family protein [Streptomyces sp. NBC_00083]MCX5386393.1 carboxylesterase family protein [Streptomyces sp. NBC_00083]
MADVRAMVAALAGALALTLPLAAPPPSSAAPVVHTLAGAVRGAARDGYRVFDGVPYAAPPVGALRWTPPRPAAAWSGVREATEPGAACAQPAGEVPGGSTSEDCLYLNVTAPAGASAGRPRPVIVWLHGGGFTSGTGSSYDAHRMARDGDVVVVTVNYRLGALGFLGRPGLAGSGTFGLADQQAALRYVRDNIRGFGGDPRNVTLAGESAGSYAVCAQLASPAAAGLFQRAIMESGPCTGGPARPFAPYAVAPEAAEAAGARFVAAVGCAKAADVPGCLRRVPVARLLAAQGADAQPEYGTRLLPRDPAEALASGRTARVPVLVGANHDEGTIWAAGIMAAGTTVTPANWPEVAGEFVPDPDRAAEVVSAYPVGDTDGGPVFGAVIGDADYACPTLRTGSLFAARGRTWRYEFADPDPPRPLPAPPPFPLGATHTTELPYLFDLGGRPREMTAAQQHLAGTMIGYWTRFARSGDPNGGGAPRWSRSQVQSLAPDRSGPVRPGPGHHCALWATMP